MKTIDFSTYFVVYNLVIGVLVMLASQKLAASAGYLNKANRTKIVRFAHVSTFAFGASIAVLSAFIYVAFHVLKIGV